MLVDHARAQDDLPADFLVYLPVPYKNLIYKTKESRDITLLAWSKNLRKTKHPVQAQPAWTRNFRGGSERLITGGCRLFSRRALDPCCRAVWQETRPLA